MNLSAKGPGGLLFKWLSFFLIAAFVTVNWSCSSSEEKKAKHLTRAQEYEERQEYSKAVIEYKNVIQIDPQDAAVHHALGKIYLKLKKGQEAFRSFLRTTELDPGNLDAQVSLGNLYLLTKKTDEARKKAELILAKEPRRIDGLLLLAGVQIQEEKIQEAIKTLDKAVSLDPSEVKVRMARGRVFTVAEQYEKAEAEYRKCLEIQPVSPTLRIELSRLYVRMGRPDDAEKELKEFVADSALKHTAFNVLGRFYESIGKWEQAETAYQEAVDAAPQDNVAPLMVLAGYYARRSSYDSALNTINEAAKRKPNDTSIQIALAQLHFEYKHIPEAEETINAVLDIDKTNPAANLIKARILLGRREFQAALPFFDTAISNEPRLADAYFYRALALIGKRDEAQAKKDLVRSLELNPRLIGARLLLAEFYLREKPGFGSR